MQLRSGRTCGEQKGTTLKHLVKQHRNEAEKDGKYEVNEERMNQLRFEWNKYFEIQPNDVSLKPLDQTKYGVNAFGSQYFLETKLNKDPDPIDNPTSSYFNGLIIGKNEFNINSNASILDSVVFGDGSKLKFVSDNRKLINGQTYARVWFDNAYTKALQIETQLKDNWLLNSAYNLLNQVFKIHLQPKAEFQRSVIRELLIVLNRSDVAPHIKQVKFLLSYEPILSETNAMPSIVIYPRFGYIHAKTILDAVICHFDQFHLEEASLDASRLPRFNLAVNPLISWASGDGKMKTQLQSQGRLDDFFDKSTNYATFLPRQGVERRFLS